MTTIVTLAIEPATQKWLEEQRRAYFPPALNHVPAHMTLFHRLPGDAATGDVLREAAAGQQRFTMRLGGVASMGRGVLYRFESPELMQLHRELSERFATFLNPQDREPLRPHVVVQNKVEPHEAKALLAQLQAEFVARDVAALGLEWWEYLGGRWRWMETFEFGGTMAGASADGIELPEAL